MLTFLVASVTLNVVLGMVLKAAWSDAAEARQECETRIASFALSADMAADQARAQAEQRAQQELLEAHERGQRAIDALRGGLREIATERDRLRAQLQRADRTVDVPEEVDCAAAVVPDHIVDWVRP